MRAASHDTPLAAVGPTTDAACSDGHAGSTSRVPNADSPPRSENPPPPAAYIPWESNHRPNRRADSIRELLAQVCRLIPNDVVILARVEMHVLEIVLMAAPDNWQAERHCETRLKLDALPLHRYVGDNEPGAADFGHDPVANLLIVMNSVDAKWLVPGLANRQLYPC